MRLGTAFVTLAAVFLAFGSAVAAEGDATGLLTPAQILAKARTAGGQLQPGSYLIVQRSTTPSMVTNEVTQISGNDSMTIDQTGPFTSKSGVYHGQNWYQDSNGVVIRETNFHSTEDPNALAWSHPDDPRYRVRTVEFTQTAPQEYVVEANPPGGQDEYRYYDANTFLLDKDVIFGVDRYRHETDYSDYRTIFGETISFRSQYGDGRPENDEDDVTTSFTQLPAQTADDALTIPEIQPIFGFLSAPVQIPARFDFNGGIMIPVTINGQTLQFGLDTGASNLVIDSGTAHRLGLKLYDQSSETIAGTVTAFDTIVPAASIGSGVHMQNVDFTALPLDFGDGVSGLLGCDFLASAVVGIDFKDQRITLYPWATFDPVAMGLHAMPIELDDCVPRVPASIENVPGEFLLDMGSFATMVYPHYLAKLPFAPVAIQGETADTVLGSGITIAGVGGDVQSNFYDIKDLVFAGIRYATGQVIAPVRTATFQEPDYDGIIGRNVLKEYDIYLDYNDGLIFSKPNT